MFNHIWRRPIAGDGALVECLGACCGEGSVVFGATGVEANNDVDYFRAERIWKGCSLAFFLKSLSTSAFLKMEYKIK